MKLNREKIRNLMEVYCEDNYNRFARELGVDAAHLHHYLTNGVGGGRKLIGGVMKFCKEKRLPFEDYIEL